MPTCNTNVFSHRLYRPEIQIPCTHIFRYGFKSHLGSGSALNLLLGKIHFHSLSRFRCLFSHLGAALTFKGCSHVLSPKHPASQQEITSLVSNLSHFWNLFDFLYCYQSGWGNSALKGSPYYSAERRNS